MKNHGILTNSVIFWLVLFLVPGVVFANGDRDQEERKEISMWMSGATPENQAALNEILVDAYNESQSEYTLYVEYTDTVDKDLSVSLMANKGPDLVYGSGPAFVANYAAAGKLANLDEYSEMYGWSDRILEPIYQSGTVGGNLYSLALSLDTAGVFYNKTMFKEYGWEIPTTIDELTAIMDEALADGLYASVSGNADWKPTNVVYASIFLNHAAGPDVMYKVLTGQQKWNSPEVRYAVELSKEWMEKDYLVGEDYFSLIYQQACALLADNKSPFFFGPALVFRFAAAYFPNENSELGFFPFPNFSSDIPYPLYNLGTTATMSINAASEHKDAAAEVLNRMMTSDFMVKMTERWPGYWGVPLKVLDTDFSHLEGLSKKYLEAIQDMMAAVDRGNFGYYVPTFFPPATQDVMVDMEDVWLGKVSVDDYLNKADQEFARELEAGLVPPLPLPPSMQ